MPILHDFPTIKDYNDFLGVETKHPLVSVVNMSDLDHMTRGLHRFAFYCIYLKDILCGPMQYGKSVYDYEEGTLICIGPNQISGCEKEEIVPASKGWILMFHPDLFLGTPFTGNMHEFHYFSYTSNEALHMSEDEKMAVERSLMNIKAELDHPTDNQTKAILASNIEVFLLTCKRFYDRQFKTRELENKTIINRFESLLDNYFTSKEARRNGLPSVAMCASKVNLSANYFGDLVKKETGHNAQEYIQRVIIDRAKEQLFDSSLTVSEIAYDLGFKYPHHLSRMFKKVTGMTPVEYRAAN